MVACAVVIADDGGAADGIAHEHRHEQKRRIHDDAVGRHAVFTRKAEQLIVIQDIDQRHGEVGHQLGRAVDTGICQNTAIEGRFSKVQTAGVVPVQEVKHRQDAAHDLAQEGRDGRALHTPMERPHQNDVQHHIGAARAHREREAQMRLFGGNEKALEHILKDEGRQTDEQDAAIAQRIVQHLALCAQQHSHRLDDDKADEGEHDACKERGDHEQAEILVRLFFVALAQRDAHDGAAARAEHEADRTNEHGQRHDEVDRRKGRFADEVRDAQAVHDAVDRSEQHRADAGQHEPDEPGIGKVIR